jgi:hypothetical protein
MVQDGGSKNFPRKSVTRTQSEAAGKTVTSIPFGAILASSMAIWSSLQEMSTAARYMNLENHTKTTWEASCRVVCPDQLRSMLMAGPHDVDARGGLLRCAAAMKTRASGGQLESCSTSSIGGLDPPNQSFSNCGWAG